MTPQDPNSPSRENWTPTHAHVNSNLRQWLRVGDFLLGPDPGDVEYGLSGDVRMGVVAEDVAFGLG